MDSTTIGLHRNSADKFYTTPSTVLQCITIITNHLQIQKTDFIIEPSAGNGAFIEQIKTLSNNCLFYDILPEHPDVKVMDFLTHPIPVLPNNKIHIIGNPPFGRQSSMAIKFIKKCCEFAHSISFILPKSFKKESMQKHFDRCYRLLVTVDLPENAFLVNGIAHDVPCVFQIWVRTDELRAEPNVVLPRGFQFTKKNENPNISVRRVGVNAGKISIDVENKSEQSHYFIKFLNGNTVEQNVLLLGEARFEHDNTVGAKSISKSELATEFNKFL